MCCYRLNLHQQEVLLDFVGGETVYELGCGDLSLAKLMATRAKAVHAVDKDEPNLCGLPDNVHFRSGYYHALSFPKFMDCVVTCWPVTYHSDKFVELVARAFRVVYIGCNTGGAACGEHGLWLNLSKRMLVKEVRDPRNCLHCYSLVAHKEPQFRSEEEVCGLLNEHGRFRCFDYGQLMVSELKAVPA